jgi:hypothetical protein
MRHATLGLLLSPLASAAQPSPKVYQIGTLWLGFSAPASLANPVEVRPVASLAHPGGNLTGLTILVPEHSGKRLELLKEAVPDVARVAVLG